MDRHHLFRQKEEEEIRVWLRRGTICTLDCHGMAIRHKNTTQDSQQGAHQVNQWKIQIVYKGRATSTSVNHKVSGSMQERTPLVVNEVVGAAETSGS
jgi:hypothetical protein